MVHALAQWSAFERGTPLVHQGASTLRCHVLVNGTAELRVLSSDGQYSRLALLEPGDLFGAYPDSEASEVEVVCWETAEIASFDTRRLRQLVRESPDLGSGLADRFARQYQTMLRQYSARITLSANGRVYGRLLERAAGGGTISPPPVVAALALEAQTTRETASRAISILERRGIIMRATAAWTIVSPRMLEEMVL